MGFDLDYFLGVLSGFVEGHEGGFVPAELAGFATGFSC